MYLFSFQKRTYDIFSILSSEYLFPKVPAPFPHIQMVFPLHPLTAASNLHNYFTILYFPFHAYNILLFLYSYIMNHYSKHEMNQSIHYIIKQCNSHSVYYNVVLVNSHQIHDFKEKETTSSQFFETAIVKFPDFSLIFLILSNSLIFPHREFFFIIFPVFPVFQSPWPPCISRAMTSRK